MSDNKVDGTYRPEGGSTYLRELEEIFVPGYMDRLETIHSGVDSQTQIVVQREFEALCPTDGHTDEYTLRVEYHPSDGQVLELETFSNWLDEFAAVEAPQEAWCNFISHALWSFFSPKDLCVVVSGEHYGVETTVSKERADS